MLINFYICNDDKKMLNKSLTATSVSTCNLYGVCSLYKPNFIMNIKPDGNYCAFDKKCYFIDDVVYNNGKWIVSCTIDPLMTAHNEIVNLNVLVSRSEKRNNNIPDASIPMRANKYVKSQSFGNDVISNSTMYYVIGVI